MAAFLGWEATLKQPPLHGSHDHKTRVQSMHSSFTHSWWSGWSTKHVGHTRMHPAAYGTFYIFHLFWFHCIPFSFKWLSLMEGTVPRPITHCAMMLDFSLLLWSATLHLYACNLCINSYIVPRYYEDNN